MRLQIDRDIEQSFWPIRSVGAVPSCSRFLIGRFVPVSIQQNIIDKRAVVEVKKKRRTKQYKGIVKDEEERKERRNTLVHILPKVLFPRKILPKIYIMPELIDELTITSHMK